MQNRCYPQFHHSTNAAYNHKYPFNTISSSSSLHFMILHIFYVSTTTTIIRFCIRHKNFMSSQYDITELDL